MQKNKILAVYPDLCDHGYISDAFMDSANEVVCVTCIIEAVKCLVEYTFIMVLVDSKMVANGNDSITTTLKTITDVPILIVNAVIYKKTPHPAEHQPHHGHAHLTLAHADHSGELHYHRILHFGELIIDPNRREVLLSGHSLLLTKIEFDILYFLARHKGRVMSRDQIYANESENTLSESETENYVISLLKLFVLTLCTSYKVEEANRNFKSEYILPQMLMLACKRRKLDGITYYSKQIPSELLACNVGVNLVLFAKYNGEESLSEICQHLEVGTSFNFALFKQLLPCQLYKTYELRVLSTPYINNVGTKNHFFPYTETQFFEFDKYLFANWHRDWTIPTL